MIDLLLSTSDSSSLEHTCITSIQHALRFHGIESRLFYLDTQMGDYLYSSQKKAALCFKNPLNRESSLSDILQIPIFHWEISHQFHHSISLLEGRHNYIGFSDERIVNALKKKNLVHLMPAIDPLWVGSLNEKWFETVCFEPLIDPTAQLAAFRRLFIAEDVSSIVKLASETSDIELKVLNTVFEKLSLGDALYAVLEMQKGARIRSLVSSFDSPIHLFGEHIGANWLVRLKNSSHVHLHSHLPFFEHFEVIKKAHFLLFDTPVGFEGIPFWFLVAPLCGAFPLIPRSSILERYFGNLPIYYDRGETDSLQQALNRMRLDKKMRDECMHSLKRVILQDFNWTKKIEELYSKCPVLA